MAAVTAGGQQLQPCYYGSKRDCSILSPNVRLQRPFRPASLHLHTARGTAPRLALGNKTSSDPLRPKRTTQPGQAKPQAAARRSCALKLAAYSEDIYALEGSFAAASATIAHKPRAPVTRAASDGQKGDHYHYLSLLSPSSAEGGTTVRKARHRDGGLVAIKGLTVQAMSSWGQLEMLEQEAAMLRSMSHPGIPSCLSTFQCDVDGSEGFFIVQKLVSGRNLQQMLDAGWRPAEQDVERIASEVLALLVYLQQQQVVHGAIEPEHIMLEGGQANGAVSLIGFSRATKVDSQSNACTSWDAKASSSIHTWGQLYDCRAPEQLAGGARLASDIYGLGCVLLYLLTGSTALGRFHCWPANLDFTQVSSRPGLNNLSQHLLQHDWQDRPSAIQAQQMLAEAPPQTQQTQSKPATPSAPAAAQHASQYVNLQIAEEALPAVIAALHGVQAKAATRPYQVLLKGSMDHPRHELSGQVTPDHSTDQESVQQPQQMSMLDTQEYEPETALSAALRLLVAHFELGISMTFILMYFCCFIGRFQIVGWLIFGVFAVLVPIYLVLQACCWYSAKTGKKKKSKEKLPPFSNYNGGLPRQQPGAKTIGHSPKGKEKPERVVDLDCPPWLW